MKCPRTLKNDVASLHNLLGFTFVLPNLHSERKDRSEAILDFGLRILACPGVTYQDLKRMK